MRKPSSLVGLFTTLLLASGCNPHFSVASINDVDEDGLSDETETAEDWDQATLVVTSPVSGDFIPLGEPSEFSASVYDGEGNLLEWDAISWSSSLDANWSLLGAALEDNTLDVGRHTILATTELPNGDRLAYAVGGVLVQHDDAGIYVGDANIDLTGEYDGTELTATCIGTVTMVVDVYGESGEGETDCTVSLMGYDMDAPHDFTLEFDDGDVGGSAIADFSYFAYTFDVEGDIGDGELSASWSDDIYGFVAVSGELNLTRISRESGDS